MVKWSRALLRNWHRRLGVALLIPVIWLSVTGVLLNHTGALQLDKRPLTGFWLSLYTQQPDVPKVGLSTSSGWVSRSTTDFFLNEHKLYGCQQQAVAAVDFTDYVALVCATQLHLFQGDQLIETLQNPLELPVEAAFKGADSKLGLEAAGERFEFDLMTLELSAVQELSGAQDLSVPNVESAPDLSLPEDVGQAAQKLQPLPELLIDQLQKSAQVPGLHMERLLLDAHAFRHFAFGWLLLDLAGLAMIVLALSGLYLFFKPKNKLR